MKRLNLFGTSMLLIETAGIVGDRNESLQEYHNQFTIPVYGYDLATGRSVLCAEHRVRVMTEYTPPVAKYDVFIFDTCVVYDMVGGLIVVRDAL